MVIFGTLKDESLLINSLAPNSCLEYKNTLSKIAEAFFCHHFGTILKETSVHKTIKWF